MTHDQTPLTGVSQRRRVFLFIQKIKKTHPIDRSPFQYFDGLQLTSSVRPGRSTQENTTKGLKIQVCSSLFKFFQVFHILQSSTDLSFASRSSFCHSPSITGNLLRIPSFQKNSPGTSSSTYISFKCSIRNYIQKAQTPDIYFLWFEWATQSSQEPT